MHPSTLKKNPSTRWRKAGPMHHATTTMLLPGFFWWCVFLCQTSLLEWWNFGNFCSHQATAHFAASSWRWFSRDLGVVCGKELLLSHPTPQHRHVNWEIVVTCRAESVLIRCSCSSFNNDVGVLATFCLAILYNFGGTSWSWWGHCSA